MCAHARLSGKRVCACGRVCLLAFPSPLWLLTLVAILMPCLVCRAALHPPCRAGGPCPSPARHAPRGCPVAGRGRQCADAACGRARGAAPAQARGGGCAGVHEQPARSTASAGELAGWQKWRGGGGAWEVGCLGLVGSRVGMRCAAGACMLSLSSLLPLAPLVSLHHCLASCHARAHTQKHIYMKVCTLGCAACHLPAHRAWRWCR